MPRYSGEVGTTGLFYATWKAPVAALDRMPGGGGRLRDRLSKFHAPEGREVAGIGQEAIVLSNEDGMVEKYFPTSKSYVDKRFLSLHRGARSVRVALGKLTLGTLTNIEKAPSTWLGHLGDDYMPMQIQKNIGAYSLNAFELRPDSAELADLSLRVDVATFIKRMHVILDKDEFVPDIQGRGDNLVVLEEDNAYHLKFIDMSAFQKDGELRNFDAGKRENTLRALGRLESLLG